MVQKIELLRCEFLCNPLGIDVEHPRLSWEIVSEENGVKQTAYQIQCAHSIDELTSATNLIWDSGKIESDTTTFIPYQNSKLNSAERVYWHVKIWDQTGKEWGWSEIAWWEMGFLNKSDWKSKWIDPEQEIDLKAFKPASYIRKEFLVDSEIEKARLYVTAHGIYETWINGCRVGDHIFMPGRTEYLKRLQYQVYDITSLITKGNNAIGAILGDGWWRGSNSGFSIRNRFGSRIELLAQLQINLKNGKCILISSDDTWKATSEGPIRKCDIKFGEIYDSRKELSGWSRPGFNEQNWHQVKIKDHGYDNLIASMGPKIIEKEKFTPKLIQTPNGKTVLDFGQNIGGYVEMKVENVPKDAEISLTHGEVLDKWGNFTQENIHLMKGIFSQSKELYQMDIYIHNGGSIVYKPRFSLKGFRYVLVEGYQGLKPENFTGIAVYSDMKTTGSFECSNPLINQFVNNTLWSQKGNFLDIPTDCPTRERSGWTGDAQVFAYTGSMLMDTLTFYTKWIKDVAAGQRDDGLIHNLSPNEFLKDMFHEGSAGWGDAAVIIPWIIWKIYGDTTIINNQYKSMKAWVEYERKNALNTHWVRKINPKYWFGIAKRLRPYLWDTKFHFGEWLEAGMELKEMALDGIKRRYFSDPEVATAYFAYSAQLLGEMATAIGETKDASDYLNLAKNCREAYQYFILNEGNVEFNRQARYVRPVALKLVSESMSQKLIDRLAKLVEKQDYHVGTGFLSTGFLCQVLSDYGYLDHAYKLMLQTTRPSWLYSVTKDATTIWENWNGIDEEGNVQLSMNHYSNGAQVRWLFSTVLGIKPDMEKSDFKHFYLEPKVGGGLAYAKGLYHSVHGIIYSEWIQDTNKKSLTKYIFEIPPNTSATVKLYDVKLVELEEKGIYIQKISGISDIHQDGEFLTFKALPGKYSLNL